MVITVEEIEDTFQALAKRRPVFHSEADLQDALAWEFHERLPDVKLRLETARTVPLDLVSPPV